jgi:hypothetical protein
MRTVTDPLLLAATDFASSFAGDWKNELGSKMHLNVAGKNVAGDYTSVVGSYSPLT